MVAGTGLTPRQAGAVVVVAVVPALLRTRLAADTARLVADAVNLAGGLDVDLVRVVSEGDGVLRYPPLWQRLPTRCTLPPAAGSIVARPAVAAGDVAPQNCTSSAPVSTAPSVSSSDAIPRAAAQA
jgi:hypothetical protein